MTAAQVQPIGFASKDLRWPLYHGTSTLALKAIRKEKRLRISPVGEQAFFMTTEKRMAEDFACSAVLVDIDRRKIARRCHGEAIPASRPVVLVLDRERLLSLKSGRDIESYRRRTEAEAPAARRKCHPPPRHLERGSL